MNPRRTDLSNEFLRSVDVEAERLRVAAADLRQRGEQLVEAGEQLVAEAMSLELRLRDLDELLGRAPQISLYSEVASVGGRELRDLAVELLARTRGLRQPIHYRGWFQLVGEQGLRVAGKDPLATFLTEITREPVVRRVQGAPAGTYELDPDGALEDANQRVRAAALALRDAQLAGGDEAPESAVRPIRQHKTKLTREQRTLNEILRVRLRLEALHAGSRGRASI